MLRSLNRRIVIGLFANHIQLQLYRRWPRQLMASRQLSVSTSDAVQLHATVTRTLRELSWAGNIELVLGNRWFQFSSLPWQLQTGNPDKDHAMARAVHVNAQPTSLDGAQAVSASWHILLDDAAYGRDRLLAAIQQHDVSRLTACTDAHAVASWQPWVTTVWNKVRQGLASAHGILHLVEPGCLTILNYQSGRVNSIRQRLCASDDISPLLSLLRMEQLQQDAPLALITDALPQHWRSQLQEFREAV